ncbi:MAG: hypothetical protein M1837_000342 [Sclerophora amabilis]|nr:MAG: hypothetical protein M1837_000342 [Sclerophora amabilis]
MTTKRNQSHWPQPPSNPCLSSNSMGTKRNQPHWSQPPHPKSEIHLPPLRIWNSLTRSKTPFVPLDPEGRRVTWYACGPTVYDDAHLGHARNYVGTDIIRRILRDYFQFEVSFVMNITDVDDKVIVRGRQIHLFTNYVARHPKLDAEVVRNAQSAYATYVEENLPLLSPQPPPARFQEVAEKTYAVVLNGGGAREGNNKKHGDNEAKVKMHIKTAASAARVIAEAITNPESVDSETFYSSAQDVFLPYVDALQRPSNFGNEYSVFTKLTRKYEDRFMQDLRDLNVLDPDQLTRVTEYVPEIVEFVERIVQNEFAYVASDGSVYFDIDAFEAAGHQYARLEPWNRGNEGLVVADGEGASTAEKGVEKRSGADFALWKASRAGEPSWSSPWGEGRPGWHIECSAMASAKLGRRMDLHSGGIDLAFPHHDNELAQSEAYWHETHADHQWVNYFLHMGHLSIQGAKMSKSLKNFTTIREALERGDWTARSLRIIFLLGGWRDGVEITEDLIRAGNAWEEKVNNFFIRINDPTAQEGSRSITDNSLAIALESAKASVYEALCDSFNTSVVLHAISELISKYNSTDDSTVNSENARSAARWVTSMVSILGLNGAASPEGSEIGWYGTEIPEQAKPYVYPLSAMRDSLRRAARGNNNTTTVVTSDELKVIVDRLDVVSPEEEHVSAPAKPYADLLSRFRDSLSSSSIEQTDHKARDILALCDRVRDVDLFDLGIHLEDRDDRPALVRPVTRELIRLRDEKADRGARLTQREREEKKKEEHESLKKAEKATLEKAEKATLEKAEKGRTSHLEMFRTTSSGDFSAWDDDGLPTKDASGEGITKSQGKKLRKEWERQRKAHELWLAGK